MFPNLTTPMPMATEGLAPSPEQPQPLGLPTQAVSRPDPFDMPDAAMPDGADMPSVPGMGVQGPTPPSQMDLLAQEIAKSRAEIAARRKQHEQFLQQMMTTDGLSQYLPKPSAKQMLSDALTNFGMARLTKGNFEPIQTRRFDEAFKRHGAAVQNAQLALSADKQDELAVANMENQSLRFQQLAERQATDQGKLDATNAERARKEAATSAALDYKKAVQKAGQPLLDAKTGEANAKAAAQRAQATREAALARLLQAGGGSPGNALANYKAENHLDLTDPDDYDEYLKVAADLRDATKPKPNPNAGMTEFHFPTKDGNIGLLSGFKGGEHTLKIIKTPEGYGNFNEKQKGELVQLDNAKALATDVMHILETTPAKDGSGKMLKDVGTGSLMNALKATAQQRLAYKMYIGGIGNKENPLSAIEQTSPQTGDPDMDKLIQYSAMLQILGTRPFMAGIRNQKYIDMLKVHLPDPSSDTGYMMYGKTSKLIPRWDEMGEEIKDRELHPISGSSAKTPPRATPATPPAKKPGVPSVGDTFEGGKVRKVTRIE